MVSACDRGGKEEVMGGRGGGGGRGGALEVKGKCMKMLYGEVRVARIRYSFVFNVQSVRGPGRQSKVCGVRV